MKRDVRHNNSWPVYKLDRFGRHRSEALHFSNRHKTEQRRKMIRAAIFIFVVATVASLPVDQVYTINVDGPDGRHVQMGEPGKAVSGYYTSRSLDGQMEYKTMYEADDKGFRATGDHLPGSPAVAAVRTLENGPSYVFKYDARDHSHYQMGEPGKAVQGSFMYYDAQGRSQKVDYEADENGYRVKQVAQEKPVEISAGPSADEVIKAADPVVQVAVEPEVVKSVEPVPVAAEPVAVAEPEVVADPAPQVVAEPVLEVAAEPVAVVEPVVSAVAVAEIAAEPAVVAAPEVVAEPVAVVEPVVSAVAVAVAETAAEPAVVAEPVAVEPVVAAVAETAAEPAVVAEPAPQVVAEPAPEVAAEPVAVPVDSVQIEIEPEVNSEVKPADDEEPKSQQHGFLTVAVPQYGAAYYRGAFPYVQPVYRYTPYSYGYGYGYGYNYNYPYGGNYVYAL